MRQKVTTPTEPRTPKGRPVLGGPGSRQVKANRERQHRQRERRASHRTRSDRYASTLNRQLLLEHPGTDDDPDFLTGRIKAADGCNPPRFVGNRSASSNPSGTSVTRYQLCRDFLSEISILVSRSSQNPMKFPKRFLENVFRYEI